MPSLAALVSKVRRLYSSNKRAKSTCLSKDCLLPDAAGGMYAWGYQYALKSYRAFRQ